MTGYDPADYAENTRKMLASSEGFSIVKQGVAFHSQMKRAVPGFYYGEPSPSPFHGALDRGPLSERGLKHLIACVAAMKDVVGDSVGLALDAGPGWMVSDAIRFARAVEPFNLLWVEDMITGDYVHHVSAPLYRDVTRATTTPIHTGEQIYLRHNFVELIETRAVSVIGPDPCDVGGLAELKWIAEFADLHSVMIAPHGTGNGLLGLAALVQVAAALPHNYIAFEYPVGDPVWWYDIVDGLPQPIVKDSMIEVWSRPGMGVEINPERARRYLSPEDVGFFD
jgi:L-alanine-DL-glutamate epimerase-like enolase superfamily enzyme